MSIRIGDAPCSRGVEFARDPRKPCRDAVVSDCAAAGYEGIELGPAGDMLEGPATPADALAQDGAVRTCEALTAHGALRLFMIDSISTRRAPSAGRADEAEQMDAGECAAFRDCVATVALMEAEKYGLTVGIRTNAAGFMDFEPELERLLAEMDERILESAFDTGYHSDSGCGSAAFMRRHVDPDACDRGVFCSIGRGDVDFPAVRRTLFDSGFAGRCVVEQDCDSTLDIDPPADARGDRDYLRAVGFK